MSEEVDLRRLTTALYGDDITTGDIPYLKTKAAKHGERLDRQAWLLIAVVSVSGAQGVGALLGGILK